MEEQKKSRKPLLVGVIAAVVVLAALLALLLTQCVGGQGPDSTSGAETTAPTAESYTLYWNVNRHDFEAVDGESTTGRKPAEDGFYHVVFAVDGKQVELRVKERRTVNIIDAYDIMGLVFDENGDVIDVTRLDDMPIQKLTWQYYIQSFGGNAVKLNSSKDMNGMEELIKTNANTVIYDVSGWSEFIGAPGKLQKEDRAYVIANMAGEITHIFLYERVGIETSFRAECKHCGEEVTWKNWLKSDSLPIQTGHYFLENPVEAKGQSQIQTDAQICLDLNGQTVHSTKVARIYSTFYAGSSLAVMDNSDGEPGKFVSEGQNMDQGCCLWARYGNIDIYDITVDGSGATSHAGGTAVAVEGGSKMTLHSGTLIGGKTVQVKGKGNARTGATVRVNNGVFVMEDGLITGGTSTGHGGNVWVGGAKSTFTMNGGKITNGRVEGLNGGNVAVQSGAEFIMNGGTISGGRGMKSKDKNANGAGGNVYIYRSTFTMNGGTITDGRCYNNDGTRDEKDVRQNFFNVDGKLYMNGGKITGYVQATDTNVKDEYPAIVSVTGGARITGAKEGGTNLYLNNTAIFKAGRLSGKAEIRVYASGIFSDKTRESNAKYVHSDVPNAEVVYYDGRLAIGRVQCLCGASLVEGKAHSSVCDQTSLLFGAYTSSASKAVSGNYYLTADLLNAGQLNWGTSNKKDENGNTIVADPITINLDLNGHKIVSKNRSMLVMPNATLNISDSVGGGYVEGKGVTLPYTNGGVLLTQVGSTVNVINATLKASDEMVETMKTGAVIQTAGTVNLYDATIIGGKLPAINIKDDVRSQGASAGAAVYVAGGSVLNMYGTSTITGGETVGNQAHGGNVYILAKGVLNMYDESKIVDGKAAPDTQGGGGNVYIASGGFMHMYDNASVTGGKADPKTQANSQDIFAVGGKLYVHGGHAGIVALTSINGTAADMTVGTNAKVDRVHRGIWNSATAKNPSTELPLIIIEGVLTDDAKIVMNNGTSLFTNETVPENADNFVHNDGKTPITYHEESKKLCIGKYSKPAATLYHCVCGMQSAESLDGTVTSKGECFGGCDGTIVEWKPWTGKTLPNQSGYWVITGGEYGTTTIGEWKGVAGTEADPSVTIFVDLNGGEVSVAKNSRAYAFGTLSEVNLTIMDSVGGGAIVSQESTNADQALLVWNRSAKKVNFNLYGGILDASAASTTADSAYGGQGAFELGANATINLYGGTVKGQNVVKGNKDKETGEITSYSGKGGAFYLASGTVMTMSGDAKVIGGEVGLYGDAIYMASDVTLTLKDNASIVNKDADKNNKAGNVYAEGGCTIGVADSVKVDNLVMKSGTYIEIDGTLADDAKIVLSGVTGTFTKKTVAENADKFVSLDEKEIFFSEEASVLYIDKYVKPYNAFHCVCGMQYTDPDTGAAASKGECIGDCSGEIVEWKAWAGSSLPNKAGYWYVNGGTYGQAIFPIDKDTEIYIDLAGNEIGTSFRAFQFKGSGKANVVLKQTLTITDSVGGARLAVDFANADEHSAIAMLNKNNNKKDENGNNVKDDKGNNVLLENALPIVTFNIYGGHLDASAVKAEGAFATTGAVNLGANATINMFGGKVTGQNVMSTSEKTFAKVNNLENVKYTIRSGAGGAFYLDSGTKMYMYNDAEIVGGTVATRGGSVFMNTGAKLYMYDNSIICDGKIEVTGDNVVNNTDTHGGNVFVSSSAVLSLNDNAMIVGGKAINECQKISSTGVPSKVSSQGGNIYANGTVEVNDNAQIKDGTSVSNANTSDVFLVGAASHLKISGYVGKTTAASTAGKITVSGSAKADLLRLATGWKIDVIGTLADDAKIIVDNAVGAFTTETVAENADNFESKDGKEVWFVESDKILCIDKYSKPATILYHCICGMQSAKSLDGTVTSKGECLEGCDGTIHEWKPWSGTTLPKESGYWVVNGGEYGATTIGGWKGVAGTDSDPSVDIFVDLNGVQITITKNARAYAFGTLSKVNLTIMDSVGGGTITSAASNNADQGLLLWNRSAKKVNFTLYGGTMDASAASTTADSAYGGQGAFELGANATINLYGGTVKGQNVVKGTTGKGGAFYLASGTVMTMSGNAKVIGGEVAQYGDAIYMAANVTLTLKDNASIVNKDADKNNKAGNVYAESGCTIGVADSVKVDNLIMKSGTYIEIDGTLADDAKIVLNGVSGVFAKETVQANANNFVSLDGQEVQFVEDAKVLCIGEYVPVVEYNKYHCVCGNYYVKDNNPVRKAPCVEGCPGAIVEWKPWTGTFTKNAENYFYFDTSRNVSQIIVTGNTTIYFDLAGKTLNSATRGFNLTGASGATNKQTIGFTDTVGGGVWNFNLNNSHSSIVMNHANGGTVEGTFKLFSGHLNAATAVAPTATQSNGAVSIGNNGKVYILGGTLTGSKYVGNDANAPVLAKTGGAINLGTGSTLYIGGGAVINGGNVTQMGGAIYAPTGCNITIEDGATINGGKAAQGAAIYTAGNVTVTDATVNGGILDRNAEAKTGGQGGAFYVAGGTLTIDNSVINGGYADELSDNDEGEYGGGAIFATAGDIIIQNGSQLVGYDSAASNIRRGGTVYVNGSANFTLDNSTITGSKVVVNGAAVHLNTTGTFTMKGENAAISVDKTKINNMNYGAVVSVQKGTFDMQDGTITGTDIVNTLGGGTVYVYGGTMKMSGGMITGGASSKNVGGGLTVTSAGALELSGDAKITGNTGGNLYLKNGAKLTVGTLVADDPATTDVNEGAQFGISMEKPGVFSSNEVTATTGFFADNIGAEIRLTENKLELYDPNTTPDPDPDEPGGEPDPDPDEPGGEPEPTPTARVQCMCGASEVEGKAHAQGCDKVEYTWTAWDGTNRSFMNLVSDNNGTVEYNLYLTDTITLAGPVTTNFIYGTNYTADDVNPIIMRIDLNGKDINANSRAFQPWVKTDLYLCNSNPGENGNFVSAKGANNSHSAVVQMGASDVDVHLMNGVTLRKVGTNNIAYGGISVIQSGTFYMYEGSVVEGTTVVDCGATTDKKGGALQLNNNGILHMYGGTVSGGTAEYGGAVYNGGSGRIVMEGGTITGGCAQKGGNVYLGYNATLEMSGNAAIKDGFRTAGGAEAGANIYIASRGTNVAVRTTINLSMSDNAEISGGNSFYEGATGGNGGNIWMGTDTHVKLEDTAHIVDGISRGNGGNINNNGGIIEMTDDSYITGGLAGRSTATNGSKTQASADIMLISGTAKLVMNSGKVGYVRTYSATNAIEVSGSAQIVGFDTNNLTDTIKITGALTSEAYIRSANLANGAKAAVITATGLTDEQKAFAASRVAGKDESRGVLSGNDVVLSNVIKHCVCGAGINETQTLTATHTFGCDKVVRTWTPYPGFTSYNLENGSTGNYYLTQNLTGQTYVRLKAGAQLCIDLNGYNITASSRAFQLAAESDVNSVLWLCNTAHSIEGTGIVSGKGPANSHSGVIQLSKGTVNMIGNVTLQLTEDHSTTITYGGIMAVEGAGKFNMYGGVIRNGVSYGNQSSGGNLYVSGTAKLYNDAQIIGGHSVNYHGGNVYVTGSGSLELNDNAKVINGVAETTWQGGNIVSYAQVTINDNAEVSGGLCGNNNPNHNSSNIFNVNGDVIITGGKVESVNSIAASTTDAPTVVISGKPEIGKINLGASGQTTILPTVTVADDLTDAKINVTFSHASTDGSYQLIARGDLSDAAWAEYEKHLSAFTSIKNNTVLTFERDGIYFRPSKDAEGNAYKYQCLCATAGTAHLEGCDTFDRAWSAWTASNSMPNKAGHWYLTSNVTSGYKVLGAEASYAADTAGDPIEMAVDLNGKTITSTGTRVYILGNLKSATLTITDSVGTATITTRDCSSGNIANDQGSLIWNRGTYTSTINIFGGTLDASKSDTNLKTQWGGEGAISVGNMCGVNHVINIAGGVIKGQNISKSVKVEAGLVVTDTAFYGNGGAINAKNTTITISGNAKVYGGNVSGAGSAIYIHGASSLTLNDNAEIIGGTAARYGGAVCIEANTSLTMNDSSKIYGGQVTGRKEDSAGGNVYVAAKANLTMNDSASIYNGTVTNTTMRNATATYDSRGGNVYALGTVTMNNQATIYGGRNLNDSTNSHGGNVALWNSAASLTMNNSATVVDGNCAGVSEGKTGGQAGNIYFYNATLNVNDTASVTGGSGNNVKSNDVFNVNGSVYMDGGNIANCTVINTDTAKAAAKIYVKGNAKVEALHLNKSSSDYQGDFIVNGALGTEASVMIASVKDAKIATAENMTEQSWQTLVGNMDGIKTNMANKSVVYQADGIYVQ